MGIKRYNSERRRKIKEIEEYLKSNTPKIVDIFIQYMVEVCKTNGENYEFVNDKIRAGMSLNGKIGGLLGDIQHNSKTYVNEQEYVDKTMKKLKENNKHEVCLLIKQNGQFSEYICYRLRSIYHNKKNEMERDKPNHYDENDITVWFGDNNNIHGLLVIPRFWMGKWENDKSEVDKVKFPYWTIEHVMTSGLVRPGESDILKFKSIDDMFCKYKSIVKSACSQYQNEFIEYYIDYVKKSNEPLKIPFIIPEHRFSGAIEYHKYRIDFFIINYTLKKLEKPSKIGIELSPQSTHRDYDKDCTKAREYYQEKNIPIITYSDKDLIDCKKVFDDVAKRYLSIY